MFKVERIDGPLTGPDMFSSHAIYRNIHTYIYIYREISAKQFDT